MSVSVSGLAVTLTEMLICGWVVCCSEPGAFGFSNERSLMYCARTMSWGAGLAAVASAGPPLVVLTMNSPDLANCDVFICAIRGVANTAFHGRQERTAAR